MPSRRYTKLCLGALVLSASASAAPTPPSARANNSCAAPVSVASAKITSLFGYRHHPLIDQPQMHEGVDLQAAEGTPVYSVTRGRVHFAGVSRLGGNSVIIYGFTSERTQLVVLYGHLETIGVMEGALVLPGEQIGTVGNTGPSTGPHLHLGTYLYDRDKGSKTPVDPLKHIQLCDYPKRANSALGGLSKKEANASHLLK